MAVNQGNRAYGVINVLINNAGILHASAVEDYSDEDWQRILDRPRLAGRQRQVRHHTRRHRQDPSPPTDLIVDGTTRTQRPRRVGPTEGGDQMLVELAALIACKDGRMPLAINCILIDCLDLDAMTSFWGAALDLEHTWTGPSGGHLLTASDGSGRQLGLMPSSAEKAAKNRVHFDLRPETTQQAEVERLTSLGARRVDIGQAGVTWVVMADPEGNEFCVLRSLADKGLEQSLQGD